ncbi:MAG: DUF1552 domain-containing protein [Deltaproteobacteria bacterium]|nr:DUF1552 domain-containing protein [Deltaproteobacteria bacterium]MBK8713350.1 DUF1552 domain-containing protein [Deltaproteobacteria bacterium]MBP7289306.1 DUF1552 domain-containing protein [Nannocystaceae bacterium]
MARIESVTTRKGLSRRALLRGAGGIALALPCLESLLPRRAHAAGGSPLRFVMMVAGTEQVLAVPNTTGAGYTMPACFASLEAIRDDIALVSGLSIPPPPDTSSPIPPGGRPFSHHGDIMPPLITGMRTDSDAARYHGPSADQVVAAQLSAGAAFESLQFRAQPHSYKGGNGGIGGVISCRSDGTQMTPQTSPHLAWEQLALGITPDDPSVAAAQMRRIARQKSVLDLVLERGENVAGGLAKADALRLEAHFDRIRELETRIETLGGGATGGSCASVADPGPDPSQSDYPSIEHGGTVGYSDEALRSEIFVDLIHMALACDLTRVAAFQSTMEQCFMSVAPLWGFNYEVHDLTHVDFAERAQVWAAVLNWQAGFFARLVEKLRDTDDGGVPMLENTVVVYTNTGGQSGHGSHDMVMAVAGRPSVLARGVHVRDTNARPSQVFQTAMHAVGVDHDFGDVPGLVGGLLV